MTKGAFSGLHPVNNFLYFTLVIIFAMLFMHPACLAIAFAGSFLFALMQKGSKTVKFSLIGLLPMLIFMALLNPAFNHAGATILFYLKNGNPITLESIFYGIAAAVMFVNVILWFACYNAVMTSDKFIYLFGRVIPALSLIFSMVLRFVPLYKNQIKVISNAQKCVGRDISQGSLWARLKNGVTILSIMTTWSLENAIETADSMKSRGYGLPGRSSFSIYRFDSRDRAVFCIIAGLGIAVAALGVLGFCNISYFPAIVIAQPSVWQIIMVAAYLALCLLPGIIDVLEELKWKRIESKN